MALLPLACSPTPNSPLTAFSFWALAAYKVTYICLQLPSIANKIQTPDPTCCSSPLNFKWHSEI